MPFSVVKLSLTTYSFLHFGKNAEITAKIPTIVNITYSILFTE